MRSIWKGSISFGLVSIPIKVVSATENHSVSFHQLHTTDGGRIRYRKVCELEDKEVPRDEIGKGFETADGETVQLTDADLASLPLPTTKTVEILGFVPREDIDPIQLDRSYYLAVDGQSAAKPYALLREALERSERVAVVKLALRGRESLGMLRVYDSVLAMHTMLWPDEIRSAAGVAPEADVTVRSAELDLADTLMDTLGELDWDELRDEYREAVEELVAEKERGGGETEKRPAAKKSSGSGNVVDLMAVLENSVQAAKESRGGGEGGDATVHELSGRRKSGAAKKPASSAKSPGTAGSGTGSGTAGKASSAKGSGTSGKSSAQKSTGQKSAAKKAPAKKTAAKKAAPAKKTAAAKSASAKSASSKKTASAKTASAKKTASARKSAGTKKSA